MWAGLGWSVATEAHPRVGSGRAAGNTNRTSHQGAQASQLPHAGGGVAGGWSCEVGGRVGRGPNRMGVGESKELEGGWVGCPQDGDRCGGLRALRGGTLSTRCNTAGRPPSGCRRRHTYAHCTDQETRLRAALNRMHGPLAAGSFRTSDSDSLVVGSSNLVQIFSSRHTRQTSARLPRHTHQPNTRTGDHRAPGTRLQPVTRQAFYEP